MDSHRPVVMATGGMVATGHPLASQEAIGVLRSGGNAFDAAIAAAAVVAVTRPSMNGLGGHNLALIWDARRQELHALDTNGPAPHAATLERYGTAIPQFGPLAASVPGAVAGWDAVLSRFGTCRLPDLLAAAIGYAETGFPVNYLLREEIELKASELRKWPGTAEVFLPAGVVPEATDVLRQTDLAATLRLLATGGAEAFYEGEIGRRLGESVIAAGGVLAASDLRGFQPRWSRPLHATYRGVDFFGQPPPSQGFVVAEELNIFEGYDPGIISQAERIHVMVEAKKLAMADRVRYLRDPDFGPVPMDVILSKDHAARQRSRIGRSASARVAALELSGDSQAGGETTYLCVVDADGNAISFIQSIFQPFGSCFIAGDTGILLNNRMTGFSTQPGHPNQLEPGKRPVMTLNTCMLFRNDRPWVVYGTPGADAQVQTNFQNAVNVIDFGMDIQTAIEAPRWRHQPDNRLLIESRFPDDVLDGLRARGHDLALAPQWERETGGAQGVMIDPNTGVLQGGADPRREGYAIGF